MLTSYLDYSTLTTFIVGHQYVVVLARPQQRAASLVEAAKEFVGDDKPHKPFVVVGHGRIFGDDWDSLVEADIADVILE